MQRNGQPTAWAPARRARVLWIYPPLNGHRPGIMVHEPEEFEGGSNVSDVQQVSDSSFEADVLQSDLPVLIDFWAPWCGPCKQIAPVVDELAKEYAGRLKIVKMNVDDNPQTPSKYGVRGIPNLILFKGGQVRDQIIGAVPKAQLVKAINQVV
jgi:thioredoxin 1